MPTPTGLPKVGEYLVWPDGNRRKVLERTGGTSWSLRIEDPQDSRGYRWITGAAWWINYLKLKIEPREK